MKLVCITGIDGAGKSTLARTIVRELNGHGVRACYIYGRTVPVLSRALMAAGRTIALHGGDPWRDYSGYAARKRASMCKPMVARVYSAAILADYLVQIWIKLLPHLVRDQVVVADRYVLDTVISDLAAHLDYSPEQTAGAIARLLRCVPRPNLTILLDVPPEVAFARKDDVPHVDYLRERRGRYCSLRQFVPLVELDGREPPNALARSVLDALGWSGTTQGKGVAR